MPELSRFFGVVIAMYFNDHGTPHFHARYGSFKAKIQVDPLVLIAGELPPRALGFVVEWATLHRQELLNAFAEVIAHRVPAKIPPLN